MNVQFSVGDAVVTTRPFHLMNEEDIWRTGPLVPTGTHGTIVRVWERKDIYPYSVELDMPGNPKALLGAFEIARPR